VKSPDYTSCEITAVAEVVVTAKEMRIMPSEERKKVASPFSCRIFMVSRFVLDRRKTGSAQVANQFRMLSQRGPKLIKHRV